MMRVLVTGASGQLGAYLLGRLAEGGHEVIGWSGRAEERRGELRLRPIDLADRSATLRALRAADPEAILHAAAVSSVGAAVEEPERARAVNVGGTEALAGWCRENGRRLVYVSTDLVFDGSRSWYREEDPAEPILTYGRSKREGEACVEGLARGLVARVSLMYGASRCGRPSFYDRALGALREGAAQAFFADEYRTPLHYAEAADLLVRLMESDHDGIVHVGGAERLSRYELMRREAVAAGIDPGLVRPNRQADVPSPERRPVDVSLDTGRLREWKLGNSERGTRNTGGE